MQAFTRDAVVLSLALAAMWSYDPGSRPDPLPQSAPPVTYQVVGVVTDDAGSPLPGARIYFDFITSRSPGTQLSEISVTAGAGGAYSATFEAVPGAMKGPAGTDDAFAFARAWVECPSWESACSYELDAQYVLANTQAAVQNFRLSRVMRITAGESAQLMLTPDAPICVNNLQDMYPWPEEFVCRTLRVLASMDGILTIEAVSPDGEHPAVEVETVDGSGWWFENPTSIPVTAGTEVRVNVEMPWGSAQSGPVLVNTTLGPQLTIDTTALHFGAVTSGGTFVSQTSAQTVQLRQSGNAASAVWTVRSNSPWLRVTPSSGSGSAELSIEVMAPVDPSATLPVSGSLFGAIDVMRAGSAVTIETLDVTLTLKAKGRSASPFGAVETPVDNATGVTGAIPISGWLLDDIETTGVTICREAVTGESVGSDPRCGGVAQIFVGNGVFIDGARPDVQTAYPAYPHNNAAGWGFMVLTNTLPNQGNGVSVFWIYAADLEGHVVPLGRRTMTCSNASATLPFGTIDTPGQGDVVSGSSYVNFGWALTQAPKFIPLDGSTLQVYVDGVAVGSPSYNHYRPDIATAFPGLANSAGAAGFKIIDTTSLSNGLHTIVWTATDSAEQTAGLGSRFFRVSHGATPTVTAPVPSEASAAMTVRSAAAIADIPLDESAILAHRKWDSAAPWRTLPAGGIGGAVLHGEEVDRFELKLAAHAGETHTGYLRVGDALNPLPIGSRLDGNVFTWSPAPGFVGSYDFVFVRWARGHRVARQEVRIILQPKGSGHVGAQVVIDTPRPQQDLAQPFVLAGWAADLDAAGGTGIDTLHLWAYPLAAGQPVFLGTAVYGGPRPDIAAVSGEQFRDSGYQFVVRGLVPGNYDLAVFAWSNVSGGFVPAKVVRVTVR